MSENSLVAFGSIPFSPAALAKPKQNLDRGWASRLQLVATGSSNLAMEEDKEKRIEVGNFAIVDGDNVVDLGNSVTFIPLTRLDKALDISGSTGEPVVVAFGEDNEEYQRIAEQSTVKDSKCMHGPVDLVFETSTCQFLELFFSNKSGRMEAPKMGPFFPISPESAKAYECEPRAPRAVTMTSKLVKKGTNKWYVPVISDGPKSLNVANPPSQEDITKACNNFMKQAAPPEKENRDR